MKQKDYGLIAYILVCIIWGSTYLAIKVGVQSFPPFLFAGIRFTIAGGILLLYSYFKKLEFPTKLNDYIKISIVGLFLLALGNSAVVLGEMRINSNTAALLISTSPIFICLLEHIMPNGEKINLIDWIGMLISFIGVFILSFSGGGEFDRDIIGIILIISASIFWAIGSVYSKRTEFEGSVVVQIGVQMFTAGIMQMIVGILIGELPKINYNPQSFGALLYLIVFGSLVGYSSYIYLVSVWPISKAGTYAYVNPVVAIILGWLFLGEQVTGKTLISTIFILAGVIIVQRSKEIARLKDKPTP